MSRPAPSSRPSRSPASRPPGSFVLTCDQNLVVTSASAGAELAMGRPAAELVGAPLATLLRAQDLSLIRLQLQGLPEGRVIHGRLPVREGRTTAVQIRLWRLEGGTGRRLCLVVQPVSRGHARRGDAGPENEALRNTLAALNASHEQLKSTQLQLIQAAKLETIGRLAAGVAHEVKNPLAIILAGSDFLAGQPPPSAEAAATLRDMQAAVVRANQVIGGLLNYAAATEFRPTASNLNRVVEDSLQLVHHVVLRKHVDVVKDPAADLPPLLLDVPKIEQVFVNLMINAVDAMGEGGTLTVRTRRTRLTRLRPDVGIRRTDLLRVGQSVVVVEFLDSGPGIPAASLERVFDPFYTTKPAGQGTGLGLAICKTILTLHGGTVWLENRPEGGAIATVVFRRVAGKETAS